MATDLKPEIINPIEFTERIQNKLSKLILESYDAGDFKACTAYANANRIVIEELKAMTREATVRVLGGK